MRPTAGRSMSIGTHAAARSASAARRTRKAFDKRAIDKRHPQSTNARKAGSRRTLGRFSRMEATLPADSGCDFVSALYETGFSVVARSSTPKRISRRHSTPPE